MAADQYREHTFYPSEAVPDLAIPPTAGTRQQTSLQAAHYDFLAYADAADDAAYWTWMVPEDFDDASDEFSVRIYWETDTAVGTEGVEWEVALVGRADGENIDVAFPAIAFPALGESLADGGAARDLNIIKATATGTTGLAKGDLMILSVRRDVDGPNDDLTDDARLIKVVIQYHTAGANNLQWGTGTAPAAGKVWRETFFRATKFVPDVTIPPAAGTRQATTLQAAHYDYFAFDDALDEAVYVYWVIPQDMDGTGAFSWRFYWETSGTTAAQTVQWELPARTLSEGQNLDSGISGLTSGVIDNVKSSSRYLAISPVDTISPASSITGFGVGEVMPISVLRDVSADDAVGDCRLIGLGIQWLADEDGANVVWT